MPPRGARGFLTRRGVTKLRHAHSIKRARLDCILDEMTRLDRTIARYMRSRSHPTLAERASRDAAVADWAVPDPATRRVLAEHPLQRKKAHRRLMTVDRPCAELCSIATPTTTTTRRRNHPGGVVLRGWAA